LPKYTPVSVGMQVDATRCAIDAIRYRDKSLWCDIHLGRESVLRIIFSGVLVHRLIQDAPVNLEESENATGIKPRNLLYEVTGSAFEEGLYPMLSEAYTSYSHFRAITSDACVDVICVERPRFLTVAAGGK